jgi:hypothetical protein
MLAKGKLPQPYYFVGDEAFLLTNQFLIPYGGTGLGPWKDSFNYHLSSMRQCIERAFGILTQRWGIFWRPLRVQHKKWATVVNVAAKLHNFLIDRGVKEVDSRPSEDCKRGDMWEVITTDHRSEVRGAIKRRWDITAELMNHGVRRPPHAFARNKID